MTRLVVMAALLAGMGTFVYVRVGNALSASVDQALNAQASEAVGHAREGHGLVDRDSAGGTTLAELVTPAGVVVRSSPVHLSRLVPRHDVVRVVAGQQQRGSISLAHPSIYSLPAAAWSSLRGRSSHARNRFSASSRSC